MSKKTLVLFQLIPEDYFFFIAKGDLSKYQGVFINQYTDLKTEEALQTKLNDIVYDDAGAVKVESFKILTKEHQWDIMISCGFFL